MMARSSTAPAIGRIQKRKTNFPQIIIFGLQRAAGPYRWAINVRFASRRTAAKFASLFDEAGGVVRDMTEIDLTGEHA